MSASVSSVSSDSPHNKALEAPPRVLTTNTAKCCGFKVRLCHCISDKTVFAIAALTGIIFITFGIFCLFGNFAPATGSLATTICQKISAFSLLAVSKLGSDPITLGVLAVSIGGGLVFIALVGYIRIVAKSNAAKSRSNGENGENS